MNIDNKDAKGRRTLLQVIKRALKARVSFLKESIEFAFKLLNHLITTGPKLDGKTLHIKASKIFGVSGHPLTKMTDMFYRVCSTIINGERALMKSLRKTRIFYVSCEG